MRVLDLFAGLGGWSRSARERGHDVVTLDLDPRFGADHVRDILTVTDLADLERSGPFDLICASPPCETLSVASIGRHWAPGYVPASPAARVGLRVLCHAFGVVDGYTGRRPATYYVIENPRCMTRRVAPRPPDATTWYCQWGERRAKPTDLWTNVFPCPTWPTGWPACHNGGPDHDAQSRYYARRRARGQTGGTQGMADAATRAVIPPAMALAVIRYVEDRVA